jgi:transcription-repair coupling factor (superfamily II helicase)
VYIPEEGQRLRMYKRIAGAESDAALTEVRAELEDRYGKPPENVLHLLAAAEIRLTCERLGIAQIERKRTAVEEPKKPAPAAPTSHPSASSGRDVGHPGSYPATRPGAPRPAFGTWNAGRLSSPLAGRYGQAPQSASLSFSSRAALTRPESNATRALRETAAARPANAPLAQAGKLKPMREMLYITFSEKLHAAPAEGTQGISPGLLMKLVARNAKNGAQLTPQGIMKWPLTGAAADVVLKETRELLAMLDTTAA